MSCLQSKKLKKERLVIRVDLEMKQVLAELALKSKRSLSDYLRLILEDRINSGREICIETSFV